MSDQQPHQRIDLGSREMKLLQVFPESYETLESIRQIDPNDTTDTQIHYLKKMSFIRRRQLDGRKVEYKLTGLGMAIRDLYRREYNI